MDTPNPSPNTSPDNILPQESQLPQAPQAESSQTSFLDSIIAASKSPISQDVSGAWATPWADPSREGVSTPPPPPKKPREPMSPMMILKAISSLLLVAIIFFGSFLAYIVFNPDQALFFVNTFGINPNDIATLLKKLLNGSFGIIILVLSIVWIITLFRAIWTPKELKRKRLLGWMTASLVGILLFGILSFWAYLFSKIGQIDFTNLGGNITMYDNILYTNESTLSIARLQSTNNIIGPITIKFDISENARQIQMKNLVQIESYSIDFDGALCNDGGSVVSGSNPLEEQGIICTFDSIRNYTINGNYRSVNRLGESINIPMSIPPIEVRWVLDIREQKNKDGKAIITIDASKLKTLGTPKWRYKNSNTILTQDSITEEPTSTPNIIYFSLFDDAPDRIFVIQTTAKKNIGGTLSASQDTVNPLTFRFEVSDLTINANLILRIEWSLSDGSLICRDSAESCEHTFSTYGKRKVIAKVYLANNESYTFEQDIAVDEPLLLTRHAVVTDSAWRTLNTASTYDPKLRTYLIQDVLPPEVLTFDARDIVVENLWYRLSDVVWTFSDGKNTEVKRWEQVKYEINNTLRYTINAQYTFSKNTTTGSGDTKTGQDSITIDVERKDLLPKLFIETTSDYIPARVTVDGSQSRSEHGEIIKFVYNFWDGRPDAVGDAIQEYEYTTPWDKEITLTITDNNGNSASIKKMLILKESPKTVDFDFSLSPGTINAPIDFSATNSNGQIEDYIWSFGDNTPTLRGYNVSHTFREPGTYNISLTIVYTDGTRKTTSKKFVVVESME